MIRGDIVDAKITLALGQRPMNGRELIKACGMDRNRVNAAVRRLRKSGEIEVQEYPGTHGVRSFLYRLVPVSEAAGHDENEAFAEAPRGRAARKAANKLMSILPPGRPRMLIMDDDGRLYAVDPNGGRAAAVLERHLDWVVGTYAAGCDVARIALDIRKQACAMSVEA